MASAADAGSEFRVSVLICTRNRPEELRRALATTRASAIAPHEVIVSDDGTDDASRRLVADEFPDVRWTKGPGIGLGANRNHALLGASGSHVLFIDDDVELASDFLERIRERWASLDPPERRITIFAGSELQNGVRITPNEQSFLGHQKRRYRPAEPLRTVVINAAVFPRQLFEEVRFDPQLVYGYDEVDLTSRAVMAGYDIDSCFEAANRHSPSPVNRDFYRPYVEASRIYVTIKRRSLTESRRFSVVAFVPIACMHAVASAVRAHGLLGAKLAWRTLRQAQSYYSRHASGSSTRPAGRHDL